MNKANYTRQNSDIQAPIHNISNFVLSAASKSVLELPSLDSQTIQKAVQIISTLSKREISMIRCITWFYLHAQRNDCTASAKKLGSLLHCNGYKSIKERQSRESLSQLTKRDIVCRESISSKTKRTLLTSLGWALYFVDNFLVEELKNSQKKAQITKTARQIQKPHARFLQIKKQDKHENAFFVGCSENEQEEGGSKQPDKDETDEITPRAQEKTLKLPNSAPKSHARNELLKAGADVAEKEIRRVGEILGASDSEIRFASDTMVKAKNVKNPGGLLRHLFKKILNRSQGKQKAEEVSMSSNKNNNFYENEAKAKKMLHDKNIFEPMPENFKSSMDYERSYNDYLKKLQALTRDLAARDMSSGPIATSRKPLDEKRERIIVGVSQFDQMLDNYIASSKTH